MFFPAPSARRPVTAVRAWAYLGINLFATPGMGSIMGGRRVVGRLQLCFSVAGFCLIVAWMFKVAFSSVETEINAGDAEPVPSWWWHWGVLCFGIAWVWSLITSISLLLEARKNSANVPPVLTINKPVPPKL